MAINIVLVEPEIPQNTGNIIRTCACTNAVLHLIKPLGFSMDEKHMRRAGLDYIDLVKINIYEDFADFENKNPGADCHLFSTKSQKNHYDAEQNDGCYLIFGKETKGLSKEILEKGDLVIIAGGDQIMKDIESLVNKTLGGVLRV